MIHDLAEIVSLVLTSPTIFLSCWVVLLFRKEALIAISANPRTPMQWFVLGVTIGFIGSILDNVYWGLAWGAHFAGFDSSKWLFANGVFSNIPFRQTAGIVAAFCHVRCAFAYGDDSAEKRDRIQMAMVVFASLIVGAISVIVLYLLRI